MATVNYRGLPFTDAARDLAVPLMGTYPMMAEATLRLLAQNYVFTTAQAADLLNRCPYEHAKVDLVDIFFDCIIDPTEMAPLHSTFSFPNMRDEALRKWATFQPAKAGSLVEFRVEDDGLRSADAMSRLMYALDSARMPDEKVRICKSEILAHPSPPFTADQVMQVLSKFSAPWDAYEVLSSFTGPKVVYPLTCAEVVKLLSTFDSPPSKMGLLPVLKSCIKDPQNKIVIVASFQSPFDVVHAEK